MNALFRRYWMPALLSSDLKPDGDPRRVRLLGEEYVAFRDTGGRVGFVDAACCHRGTSLVLGRNEAGGLRCLFHGWKYDVDGTILETPNVPDARYRARFKQPAYPVREAGELIWVYLGHAEHEPPFRMYEYMQLPSAHRVVMRLDMNCNYLQMIEGALDSGHIGMLHADFINAASAEAFPEQMRRQQEFAADMAPHIEVRETEFGFHYAALRKTNNAGEVYVRVTAYVAPATVLIPPNLNVLHYIPYDDTHTGWIVTHWNAAEPLDRERVVRSQGLDIPGLWVDDRIMGSADNGYLQDRQAMRNGKWSGLHGVLPEDALVNIAQGPVLDRTKEHLVQGDAACIAARRLLLDGLARTNSGTDPPGLHPTSAGTIQALDFTIPEGTPWAPHVPGNVETNAAQSAARKRSKA